MSRSGFQGPKRQRGIFDLSFGAKSSSTHTHQTETQTAERKRDTSVETDRQAKQQETTRLLSPEVQAALETQILALIGNDGAGGGAASTDAANLARELASRAAGAEQSINDQSQAILSEAERVGTKEIQKSFADLATNAGSGQNTVVRLAQAEGQAALQSQLAALAAQLGITARATGTQEYGQALTGLIGAGEAGAKEQAGFSQQVGTLLASLRGAEATTQTTATEQQSTLETLNELINTLTKTAGKSKTNESGGAFGISI